MNNRERPSITVASSRVAKKKLKKKSNEKISETSIGGQMLKMNTKKSRLI